MKKVYLLTVLFSMVMLSCKKEISNEESIQTDSLQTERAEIIIDSVTNNSGVTLKMTFDNAAETALLELNGEKIELKQERMGSGIKYSNTDYQFTEHQGKITLAKAGKTIYTYED